MGPSILEIENNVSPGPSGSKRAFESSVSLRSLTGVDQLRGRMIWGALQGAVGSWAMALTDGFQSRDECVNHPVIMTLHSSPTQTYGTGQIQLGGRKQVGRSTHGVVGN